MRLKTALALIILVFSFIANAQTTKSRSAKTGRYVTKSYADKHKSTTITNKSKTK